ncbi:MAG: VOC family protein, partial [Pseudomonadota bacterium]
PMLTALDHVNLHTDDPESLAQWYERVLGLKRGPRPTFPFPGVWLYIGETAVVHLVKVDQPPGRTQGSLEHFAFRASGMAEFEAVLEAEGIACEKVELPEVDIIQFNVRDPLGTHIHVDFRPSQEPA